MGIYFSKMAAIKAKRYFRMMRYIEKDILHVVEPNQNPPMGMKDVYFLLYKKNQPSNVKRLYTKNQNTIKNVFQNGLLIKMKYCDGAIVCPKADLYLLKNQFTQMNYFTSEGNDWPIVLTNDKFKMQSITRNKSFSVSLIDIVDEMQNPPKTLAT